MPMAFDRVPYEMWAIIADAADPASRLALAATHRSLYDVARRSPTPQRAAIDLLEQAPMDLSATYSRQWVDDLRQRCSVDNRQLYGDGLVAAISERQQILYAQIKGIAPRPGTMVRAPGLRLPGFRFEVWVLAAAAAVGLGFAALDVFVHPLAGATPQMVLGAAILARSSVGRAAAPHTSFMVALICTRNSGKYVFLHALWPSLVYTVCTSEPVAHCAIAGAMLGAAHGARALQGQICGTLLMFVCLISSPLGVAQAKGFHPSKHWLRKRASRLRADALHDLRFDSRLTVPLRTQQSLVVDKLSVKMSEHDAKQF